MANAIANTSEKLPTTNRVYDIVGSLSSFKNIFSLSEVLPEALKSMPSKLPRITDKK